MKREFRFLIIETITKDANSLINELNNKKINFTLECIESKKKIFSAIKRKKPDAIFLQYYIPDSKGVEIVNFVKQRFPSIPFIYTYKSPGGPPSSPTSPYPVIFKRMSVSTPGGILTLICSLFLICPWPEHSGQGSVIIFPAPWHWGQVVDMLKNPRVWNTCPAPLQVEQVFIAFEEAAPVPWHLGQLW